MPPIVKNSWKKFTDNIVALMMAVIIGLLSAIYNINVTHNDKTDAMIEKMDNRASALENSEYQQDIQIATMRVENRHFESK